MLSFLNDEKSWLKSQPTDAPLSRDEIASIQKEIDSIIGTGGGGNPILKLVWNGDQDYWEEFYIEWNAFGEPTKSVKRPQILYRSIWSDDKKKFIKDIFVPRWLLLRRAEPEQYAKNWKQFSYMTSSKFTRLEYVDTPMGERLRPQPQKILFRPPVPPAGGWYRWFMTIGEHNSCCCMKKAALNLNCFGSYAHPRAALDELYRIAEARKNARDQPFASSDEIIQREAERGNHNYFEQSLRSAENARDFSLEHPEIFAPNALIEQGASLSRLREAINEEYKRETDIIEKRAKPESV